MLNSIPEKLLRLTMEKFLPILAFFLFLAVVALILSFVVRYAWSAPFLVSDPYSAEGQQPAEFVVTISGLTAPVITPAVETPQGKILRLDLGPLNLSGSRQITAKARNAWGTSADSSPFIFTAGPPGPVTGITLSATE